MLLQTNVVESQSTTPSQGVEQRPLTINKSKEVFEKMKKVCISSVVCFIGIAALGGCTASAEPDSTDTTEATEATEDVAASESAYQAYGRPRTCNTSSVFETAGRAFQEIPELSSLPWGSCERANAVNMVYELDFRNCDGGGYRLMPSVSPGGGGYCPNFHRLASSIPQWFASSVWNGGRSFYMPRDQSWRTVNVSR